MSKAIMISIKPKWVAKILNGEKTIEIRKTMPKCDLPIDVYIYCTKEDDFGRIKDLPKDRYFVDCVETPQDFEKMDSAYNGKGKVVAKFTLNKITPTYHFYEEEICSLSCLSDDELFNYLGHGDGYAWHIDNIVIFDKPKELSEFNHWTDKKIQWYSVGEKVKVTMSLTNAPQNYCYVEIGK